MKAVGCTHWIVAAILAAVALAASVVNADEFTHRVSQPVLSLESLSAALLFPLRFCGDGDFLALQFDGGREMYGLNNRNLRMVGGRGSKACTVERKRNMAPGTRVYRTRGVGIYSSSISERCVLQ